MEPDETEAIDASAWEMWKLVLKTCGPLVATRTAIRYAWMIVRGQA